MTSTLLAQREEFQAKIDEAKKLLAFNDERGVKFFRIEGHGPQVDITKDINDDHRTLIKSYSGLVKVIDEMISRGG